MKVIWEKERLDAVYSRMIHLASATSYDYFLRVITYAQFNSIRKNASYSICPIIQLPHVPLHL